EGAEADDPAVLEAVLRHVFHRFLETEEAGSRPWPLGKPDVLLDPGHAPRAGGSGQELTLEVASQEDRPPAVAEGRAKRVRRLRLVHAGQNRSRPDRAAVVHPALDLVPQLGMEDQPLGLADRG